ncbi:hypothetical protein MPSEU_000677900 [Mayamaea pseudoterrestris]|nr:hypothetical protein MPSEU_000677900 [Mayamaea pseudoterrestris]
MRITKRFYLVSLVAASTVEQATALTTTSWRFSTPIAPRPAGGITATQCHQPLFYRNRHIHEEQFALAEAATATIAAPPSTSPSSSSPLSPPGTDNDPIRNMMQSQGTVLVLAVTMTLVLGDFAILTAIPATLHATGHFHITLLMACLTAIPMIAMDTYLDKASNRRDASHRQSSMTHAAATMFGRRRSRSKEEQRDSQLFVASPLFKSSSTSQVLGITLVVSIVAAVSEHLVFRHLLLLHCSLVMPLPLAVLVQGIIFGLSSQSLPTSASATLTASRVKEQRLAFTTQTLLGIILGMCYVATGFQNAFVPVFAHAMYLLHVTNASWHLCNDQLDWVDDCSTTELPENALSSSSLSSDYYLQRFFYAFDEERQHSLSLHNAQRAVAFAFADDANALSIEDVEKVYNGLISTQHKTPTSQLRLELSEFGILLKILKGSYKDVSNKATT